MAKIKKGYAITSQSLPKQLSEQVHVIDALESLPVEGCLFVVIDFDQVAAFDMLSQLRLRPHYQLSPIFYLGTPPQHADQILDGLFDSNSHQMATAIQDRLEIVAEAHGDKITDFDHAIVSYLFPREHFILKGFLDYHSRTGFKYPLLDILGFQEESEHYWYMLQSMENRKLLTQESMVDEIQNCPYCHSGLLNFKNCCPNCSSTHITTQSFIHCFTCGNVGPLSEFLQQEELICNRCHVKLRHIGIDYDKPMEDKICQDCHHYFFESNVNAVCMVCEKLSDPNDLESRKLFEYRLGARGESLAKGIEQHLVVELSQFLKLIDLSIFLMTIKWQTLMAQRYDDLHFSLLALRIENEDELIATQGSMKTEKILMDFFERIRQLLRSTDLVSRDTKTILFFLPMTPIEGCEIIINRIHAFTHDQEDGIQIKISSGILPSNDILENKIASDLLLTELYNRIVQHD